MDISTYVTQLRNDLLAAAAAGDEGTRNTAVLLAGAVEPAARLAVMNALSDMAAEVTAALDDRVVELKLDGRDVRVSVSRHDGDPSDPAPAEDDTDDEPQPQPWESAFGGMFGGGGPFGGHPGKQFKGFGDSGDISRVTLRLVEQLKGQAEEAAASQNMSLNSWLSQVVQGALQGQQRHSRPARGEERGDREAKRPKDDGRRLRGWVQG